MVEYKFRGYVLEMSLISSDSYFKIKGTVSTHPNIVFYSDASNDYINSVQKKFEKWVNQMLEEGYEEKYCLTYRGVKLPVWRDTEEGYFKGELESSYDGKYGSAGFKAHTIEELKEKFEQYVWDLYVSYLKYKDLSGMDDRLDNSEEIQLQYKDEYLYIQEYWKEGVLYKAYTEEWQDIQFNVEDSEVIGTLVQEWKELVDSKRGTNSINGV